MQIETENENAAETIIDKLEKFRQQRHEAAQMKYSEILQRYDAPRPGDAEALDQAMAELKIDRHHLENDVHLIRRYRMYLKESESAAESEAKEQATRDAQGIRAGSRVLFLSVEKQNPGQAQ